MINQRKWIAWTVLLLALAFTVSLLLRPAVRSVFSPETPQGRIVVIDAGHGGADGGAASADGSMNESQVNLQVTRRLAQLLLFCGEQVALTRTDENDLSSPDASTIREKKTSDLKNRAAAINGSGADILISIHQNSFPQQPSVHGAQVFYNTADHSRELALSVQQSLNQVVNSTKERNIKAIDSSVYLMNHVNCTAILVECGFLSNSTEAQQLCTDEHQKKLALSIAAGYLQMINEGIT